MAFFLETFDIFIFRISGVGALDLNSNLIGLGY